MRHFHDQIEHLCRVLMRYSLPVAGSMSAYCASSLTACMNASVTPTLMLKLVISLLSRLQVMIFQYIGMVDPKDAHIGASSRPALFYRLGRGVEYLHKADRAALAIPPVDRTLAPLARSLLKLKPVPPPLLCISAAFFRVSNIPSMLSSTGSTNTPITARVPCRRSSASGVRHKLKRGHHLKKVFFQLFDVRVFIIQPVRFCDMLCHPLEHIGPVLLSLFRFYPFSGTVFQVP